ncbi:unnamed protein product [Sphacelaria rigidula]
MLFSSCATRLCTSNTRATSGDFQHVRTNDEMLTKKSAFRDNSVDFAEPTPHGKRLDGWADEFASRWVHGSGRICLDRCGEGDARAAEEFTPVWCDQTE